VLRDRGPSDVEAARDVADRELLARDEPKDLAAAWLAECGKRVDFLSVSASLRTVKAVLVAAVTDSRLNHDRSGVHAARGWREPSVRDPAGGNGEMAAIAQELDRVQARHWAPRPLPEPPRSHRLSKSAPPQHDRIGLLLEDWMRELTVGNTLDGE
jgi:hypothetical protein